MDLFLLINLFLKKHFNVNLNVDDLFDLFEPGHLDTLSFGSLCFSLKNLSKYGIKKN